MMSITDSQFVESYIKGYMFNVKIFYKDGKHKYANVFNARHYKNGVELGTIVGYRRMNFIERFHFRNCL